MSQDFDLAQNAQSNRYVLEMAGNTANHNSVSVWSGLRNAIRRLGRTGGAFTSADNAA
jgi:hypothetical protein